MPKVRKVPPDVAEAMAAFSRPGRSTPEPFSRKGATRPRITIAKQFGPVLTERQKTASGRRYRQRAAQSWGKMRRIMKKTDMTMQEFVEQLSDEELVRGHLADKNGGFSGKPPEWVPREFHRACVRELLRRGQQLWRENYLQAIEVLTKIANDARVKPSDRLKAAQYVIERIEGKIPERIEVNLDAPWEGLIVDIVAEVSEEQLLAGRRAITGQAPIIIDGQVFGAGDDEEDARPVRRQRTTTPRRRK